MLRSLQIVLLAGIALGAGGCPTVDVGDMPVPPAACRPDRAMFESDVWPSAMAPGDATQSCVAAAGCHARDTGRSSLRLIAMPASSGDFDQNYDVVIRFLNCNTPDASTLLTKPSPAGDPHAGGNFPLWETGATYDLVRAWIDTGS